MHGRCPCIPKEALQPHGPPLRSPAGSHHSKAGGRRAPGQRGMSEFLLDLPQVRRRAGRAAATVEKHDALEREVEALLLDRLGFYLQTPGRVVDVGAGTGRGTAALKKRYPKAEVIAID